MNKILKKSIENIRIKQIQEKVNLEAELEHNKHFIGNPMQVMERANYLQKLGKDYLASKIKYV